MFIARYFLGVVGAKISYRKHLITIVASLANFWKCEINIGTLCKTNCYCMGYIIGGIFVLWILWGLGSWLFGKIRDSVEDRAIRKNSVKEALAIASQNANRRLEPQIQQSKEAVNDFRKLAHDRLPGLQDRMNRNSNQQFYIHHVLPYKSGNKKRRK